MISKIDFFYADWCKPCQRMTPQKKQLIEYCKNNNITINLHKAPDDIDKREKFRQFMLTFGFKKIPSLRVTLDCNVFKNYCNMDESSWELLFKNLKYYNADIEEDDDF